MSNIDPHIRITEAVTDERTQQPDDTMADATIEGLLSAEESHAGLTQAALLVRMALGGGVSEVAGEVTSDGPERPQSPGLTRPELRDYAHLRRLRHFREVQVAMPSGRAGRRRGPFVAVAAAAVAVLAISLGQLERDESTHRSEGDTGAVQLGEARIEDGNVRLDWATIPFASVYHVTVFDSTGSLLLTEPTRDTTILLPASDLPQGAPSFWRVRARVAAGRWLESRMGEFRVPESGR